MKIDIRKYEQWALKKGGPRVAGITWKIARFLMLTGICYVLLFPVLYMISTAIKPSDSYMDPSQVWIPRQLTLKNFEAALDAMDFANALRITLLICIVSAVLSVVSCALVGYGFARFKFKGNSVLFGIVLLTLIVPPQTTIISSFINFKNLNLLDTPFTFYLPAITATGIRSGLFILIFRQFFKGMAKELDDAAKIDGCNAFDIFLRVISPNAKPAYLTVFLFSVVWYWNDYYLSTMYFSSIYPISVSLTMLRSGLQMVGIVKEYVDPMLIRTYLQAGSLIAIAPIILLYIFTQRFFTESLEKTGIIG